MAKRNRRDAGGRAGARAAAVPPPPKTDRRFTRLDLCLAILIVAATALAYSPVRHNDFITFDDPVYVSANPDVQAGLGWNGVKWAFTTTRDGNWFPLTWLSHMADAQAFGEQSGPKHVVSLLMHLLSALMLYLLLRYATGARWPAALVALLFGVHPLHVESVAWASERKDVLNGVFWMATLWAYVHYARQPNWRRYLLVALFFVLGLMSKPMIVTLPFVLLLLDVWPLGRMSKRAIVEKLPLFALAVASATVTFLVQHGAGAVAAIRQVSPGTRIANAIVAYVAYLESFLWPAGLAPFYPYTFSIPAWQALGAAIVIVAVSAIAWRQRTARPYVAVGWFWFVGTLVPVIGLVQVGSQARADRYMYIPLVGLAIALAWGLAELAARRPRLRSVIAGASVACCCACAVLTWAQVRRWRDDTTLFQWATEVTANNAVAHDGFGRGLLREGRLDEAIAHFREAVRIDPLYAGSRDNLGTVLLARDHADEAVVQLREAVRLDPNLPQARAALGAALRATGRRTEALAAYAEAVRRWPGNATARAGYGLVLAESGRTDEAIPQLREAIRLSPEFADAHYNLARALILLGRLDEAAGELARTLRIKPGFAEAHYNLANLLAQAGRMDGAIAEYREAVRLKPDYASARANLGSALATAGRLDEAIAEFTEALRLQPDLAAVRANLEYAQRARAAAGR